MITKYTLLGNVKHHFLASFSESIQHLRNLYMIVWTFRYPNWLGDTLCICTLKQTAEHVSVNDLNLNSCSGYHEILL